jgi:glycosyltransferase involved in cell wall biosynthesis
MSDKPDISVVIATHNRAAILGDTLKHMTELDRKDLNVEFVIVDNNSTDNTKGVIASFADRLPLRYLFESKPGQNYARNRALADAELGDIVAFTDDDIEPNRDWFQVIRSASGRWPQYNVFGGRIFPVWPDSNKPGWTEIRVVQELGFAAHDYADHEELYESDRYPSSGNFWVRRSLMDEGYRFDEAVEWSPTNRIMGTETIFLRHLVKNGQRVVHCPSAVVGHKITTEQVTLANLLKRAYSWGRGMAYLREFCRGKMLQETPWLWYFLRVAAIIRDSLMLAVSMVALAWGRPQRAISAMQWLGFNVELMGLAPQYRAASKNDKV